MRYMDCRYPILIQPIIEVPNPITKKTQPLPKLSVSCLLVTTPLKWHTLVRAWCILLRDKNLCSLSISTQGIVLVNCPRQRECCTNSFFMNSNRNHNLMNLIYYPHPFPNQDHSNLSPQTKPLRLGEVLFRRRWAVVLHQLLKRPKSL